MTRMNRRLAETYARHPGTEYYDGTFCAGCHDHFPLNEFVWVEKGKRTEIRMDQVSGKPGVDLTGGD